MVSVTFQPGVALIRRAAELTFGAAGCAGVAVADQPSATLVAITAGLTIAATLASGAALTLAGQVALTLPGCAAEL